MMAGEKENCFICRNDFHFGEHRYHGRWLASYQIHVCTGCLNGNWDGLADSGAIRRLFEHLDKLGIERPEPNEKGWIPLK